MIKIYVHGADNSGWATDTDAKLAKQALSEFALITDSVSKSDVIHTIWPNQFFIENQGKALKKPVVAVFQGNPIRLFNSTPGFLEFCQRALCVAQTTQAQLILKENGFDCSKIPYIADMEHFFPVGDGDADLLVLKKKYHIPNDKYIIGNFMRDSLGSDLTKPKLEKGPDIFLDIITTLAHELGSNSFHVLLAGPRRHWLKQRLSEANIPYSYVGQPIEGDDYPQNILNPTMINKLIALCNLILVTSRSEGGPRAILETTACKVPILSTPVGLARDVLHDDCIYERTDEAVDLIKEDMSNGILRRYTEEHYKTLVNNHSVRQISKLWQQFYEEAVSDQKIKIGNGFITNLIGKFFGR